MKTQWDHESIWGSKEAIAKAVAESKSMRQVLVSLGIEPSSRRYAKLREQCEKFGIELKFDQPRSSAKRFADSEVFVNPSVFGRNNSNELKLRALNLGYVQNSCEVCGQEPNWNGLPLTLHLDHIDGNYRNNLPENLRTLCPHCHSQTKTFGSKNANRLTCKNNHPWIPENLWKRSRGNVCKICAAKYNQDARNKEKERNGWIK